MEWEIDNLLKHPEPFRMPEHQASELKIKAFKQIFEHHYNNCEEYRKYCELYNLNPHDIKTISDLAKIPAAAEPGRDGELEHLVLFVPNDAELDF